MCAASSQGSTQIAFLLCPLTQPRAGDRRAENRSLLSGRFAMRSLLDLSILLPTSIRWKGCSKMAQKVQVVLTDDIDGSEGAETVSFSYNGVDYELDLSAKNAKKFHDNMQFYADHGRRVGGRARRSSRGGKTTKVSSDNATIRAWAKANGIDVPARGRISSSIREQFEAAQAS
jgi:nucleoid-associated protein Lsr2